MSDSSTTSQTIPGTIRDADCIPTASVVLLANEQARPGATPTNGAQKKPAHKHDPKAVAEEAWPKLQELPDAKVSAPTSPPELIPAPIRDWVMDCAERAGVYPEMVLVPYLIAVGSVIGRRCVVVPKRHDTAFKVRPDLWGAIVARPSLIKTTIINESMSALRRLEATAYEQYEITIQKHSARKAEIEDEIDALKRVKSSEKDPKKREQALLTAKESLAAKRKELAELKEPIRRRYQTQNATPESLVDLLRENPRGLLVHRDELMGILDGFSRAGHEGERQLYLEGWNNLGSYTVDRIGRGNKFIPSLGFSVFGGTQPAKMRDFVHEASGCGADGFLARFQLLVWPDGLPEWKNVDRIPNHDAKRVADGIISYLDTFDPMLSGAEQVEGEDFCALRFDTDAQDVFDTWRDELEVRLRSEKDILGNPAFEAHLGKYRSFVPALAEIVHLIDAAASQGRYTGRISAIALALAVELAGFFEAHARKLYDIGATSPGRNLAQLIEHDRIKDGDPLREIAKRNRTTFKGADAVKAAAEEIEPLGWCRIEERKPEGRGRTAVVLRVHPDHRKDNSGTVEGEEGEEGETRA
jgi:hypothetical protein